jgi:hypothetical protein
MKGEMGIYGTDWSWSVKRLDDVPSLEELRDGVKGDIELVSPFDTVRAPDDKGVIEVRRCVVFCNESGKNLGLPINERATLAWHEAMLRKGQTLMFPDGSVMDVLVGPVVVITGDTELLRAL